MGFSKEENSVTYLPTFVYGEKNKELFLKILF